MQLGIGKASAKTILFGEHSVVYGYPAIAIPLNNFSTVVEIKQSIERRVILNNQNIPLNIFRRRFSGIFQLIQELRLKFDFRDNLEIDIKTNIPNKGGLGSSASIAVAMIRAFYDYLNADLKETDLIKHANTAEMVNHSNASGIDIQTIVQNNPIYFSKSEGFTNLRLQAKGYVLLLDSNMPGDTFVAVEKVRSLYEKNVDGVTEIFEKITKNEVEAMNADTDDFGKYFTKNHNLLKKLGVSTQELDSIVEQLIDLGAEGAKLTGGGLGGSVIAFFKTEEEAKRVRNELDDTYSIWISKV